LIAIVVGLLLLLGGVGAGVYFLAFSKTSPPKGWKEYSYADAGFKAYFPQEPIKRGGRGPIPAFSGLDPASMYQVQTTTGDGDRIAVMVGTVALPPGLTKAAAEQELDKGLGTVSQKADARTRVTGPRSVSWIARGAKEIVLEENQTGRTGKAGRFHVRFAVTDTHMFIAGIGMEDGDKLDSRTINGFFDNVQPLK
jgi:hypothetical protein